MNGVHGVIAAVMVGAILWLPLEARGQDRLGLSQNALAGSQVFGSKGCVKCHSVNGLGGNLGPDLGGIARRRSFYDLAATLYNHLPRMQENMRELGIEYPEMDEREAGNLIAFLFTLDYFDPPGNVEAGQRLFEEKSCVVCHQVGVYGGVVGPSLDHLSKFASPISVATSMWNHGPAMQAVMAEKGLERPTFTGSELVDLVSYLESVAPPPLGGPLYVLPGDPEEGRLIFTERACIECHSVQGVGGRVGPDLARQGRQWGLTEFAAAMWNKAPAMLTEMRAKGVNVPQLGAGEMADLVAYLYSVQYLVEGGDAESGRRLLQAKGCLTCHSLDGRGASLAADLARRTGMGSPAEVIATLWSHSALMISVDEIEVEWPTFSSEEMADVAAFFQTQNEN